MSSAASSLLSLLVVLALIPVSLWIVRRFTTGTAGRGGQGPIQIRASVALGPRERILIVEAAGRHLLVGVTAQSMQTLAEFDDPVELEDAAPASFARLLKGMRRS